MSLDTFLFLHEINKSKNAINTKASCLITFNSGLT
jgi:hypothetical protein